MCCASPSFMTLLIWPSTLGLFPSRTEVHSRHSKGQQSSPMWWTVFGFKNLLKAMLWREKARLRRPDGIARACRVSRYLSLAPRRSSCLILTHVASKYFPEITMASSDVRAVLSNNNLERYVRYLLRLCARNAGYICFMTCQIDVLVTPWLDSAWEAALTRSNGREREEMLRSPCRLRNSVACRGLASNVWASRLLGYLRLPTSRASSSWQRHHVLRISSKQLERLPMSAASRPKKKR